MTKPKKIYSCTSCGFQSSNWLGQCPKCNSWNTFEEELILDINKTKSTNDVKQIASNIQVLSEVRTTPLKRTSTNIAELDRVLGGGFVHGQVVLLGGEPGVGKSTLLTELAKRLSDKKILYVCGEESLDQVRLRAERLGYKPDNLYVISETNVDVISSVIDSRKDIEIVIADSIQTLYYPALSGMAGSLTQIKGCTQVLTAKAKQTGIPIVLVGHVTKEGVVAGPKVLEHIVDTVLYLEGDSQHLFRVLRTSKNRFGPVSEVGIFEMYEGGIREVLNPSELFLGERSETAPGTCVTAVMEGYRPLLFEVQALTVKSNYGYPKRTASGFNANRLWVLLALMERTAKVNLSNHDVYLNVAGGFKITEYAADLAICCAIASSITNKPIKPKTIIFGECGLSGEVRTVPHQNKRIEEARKMGYENVVSPKDVESVAEAIKKALGPDLGRSSKLKKASTN